MNPINKNRSRTITLALGILTALLLIFGSFTVSGSSALDQNLFSWIYQSAPLSEVINFSTSLIKTISSIAL